MKKMIFAAAVATVAMSAPAHAFNLFGLEISTGTTQASTAPVGNPLVFGEGQVYNSEQGVVDVADSHNTQAAFANGDTVVVAAGQVVINAAGVVTTVSINDIRHLSDDERTEFIVDAVGANVADARFSVEGEDIIDDVADLEGLDEAELREKLENGTIEGLSHEEIQAVVDEANLDAIEEAVGAEVREAIENEVTAIIETEVGEVITGDVEAALAEAEAEFAAVEAYFEANGIDPNNISDAQFAEMQAAGVAN